MTCPPSHATLIDEDLDGLDGTRVPCPECGSTGRRFGEHVECAVRAGLRLKRGIKRRRDGDGKPYREEVDGDDFWRAKQKWTQLTRIIDRENDWYSETVVDPQSGEVVHRREEPPSAHRGHGSAKRTP